MMTCQCIILGMTEESEDYFEPGMTEGAWYVEMIRDIVRLPKELSKARFFMLAFFMVNLVWME